jgi:hypothetical protein
MIFILAAGDFENFWIYLGIGFGILLIRQLPPSHDC